MRRPSRAFRRYLLLELPGWALAAVLLWVAVGWGWLGAGPAAALLGLWVAKDLALYPWLRDAYEPGDSDPAAALVGRTATVSERLAPEGRVRLGSELWRAELAAGTPPVEVGAAVRVLGLRGLTLRVEPGAQPPCGSPAGNPQGSPEILSPEGTGRRLTP